MKNALFIKSFQCAKCGSWNLLEHTYDAGDTVAVMEKCHFCETMNFVRFSIPVEPPGTGGQTAGCVSAMIVAAFFAYAGFSIVYATMKLLGL